MTLVATNKHDRRAAMLSPYAAESEASVARAMSRGIQPKGLDALISWFRELIHEEAPITVHKRELWRDYGHDGDGGSKLGSLAYSDPFRRFIEGYASQVDEDGRYRFPMRAALSRMSRRDDLEARLLYQLALLDGDCYRLADHMSYPTSIIKLVMRSALHDLWREYAEVKLHIA